MAAAADLTLKNDADANVTFNVYSVEPDAVEWVESGATSILGMCRARLSRKVPADKANGVYRIGGKLALPVVDGDGVLTGTMTFNFELLRPAHLTATTADEAYARFKAFVGQAIVKSAAQNGAIPT
jgi:hypothetical protein